MSSSYDKKFSEQILGTDEWTELVQRFHLLPQQNQVMIALRFLATVALNVGDEVTFNTFEYLVGLSLEELMG